MEQEIKKLVLFEPLFYSKDAANNGEKMSRFTTKVNAKCMEPVLEDYLTEGVFCGYSTDCEDKATERIPAGTYAFVQWSSESNMTAESMAEALWLECVWQELQTVNNTLYLRELSHGEQSVFQLFREIKADSDNFVF